MSEIPQATIDATAKILHDDECSNGDTKTCGRWKCGSDPGSQFHSLHVGHVEFYQGRAREVLEAAAPHIRAAERQQIADWLHRHGARVFVQNIAADGTTYTTEEPLADLLRGEGVTGTTSEDEPPAYAGRAAKDIFPGGTQ